MHVEVLNLEQAAWAIQILPCGATRDHSTTIGAEATRKETDLA